MSDGIEWGPWIELDGSGAPYMPVGTRFECVFSGPGISWPDGHQIIPETWPGFRWSWKKVRLNWFESIRRRVCDQPDYAPIIRIRILKPPAKAVDRLAEIAADPYAPPSVVNPEGPVRRREGVPG
jgi:hypothetical protein